VTRITGTLHEHLGVYLWYLAEFFLEWEMFQSKVIENIKTYILCSITFFFRKSCRLWELVEKYGRARRAADDDITWHMRFAFWETTAMLFAWHKMATRMRLSLIFVLYVHCHFCFQVLCTFEICCFVVCIRHHCQACYIPRRFILPDFPILMLCGPHGGGPKHLS